MQFLTFLVKHFNDLRRAILYNAYPKILLGALTANDYEREN